LNADARQVRHNVDLAFQAMANYYQAECGYKTPPANTTPATPGLLNPTNPISPPSNPYVVDMTQLHDGGFLPEEFPLSPIVDNSNGATLDPQEGYGGFVVQFNRAETPSKREIKLSAPLPGGPTTADLGSIIHWRIQVAVLLRNTRDPAIFKELMAADCVSHLDQNATGSETVVPCEKRCTTPPCPVEPEDKYVVWERLPSFATPDSMTTFNQMYTTYPILNLTNGTKSQQQNYLCGS
jgi:hypothetical protein